MKILTMAKRNISDKPLSNYIRTQGNYTLYGSYQFNNGITTYNKFDLRKYFDSYGEIDIFNIICSSPNGSGWAYNNNNHVNINFKDIIQTYVSLGTSYNLETGISSFDIHNLLNLKPNISSTGIVFRVSSNKRVGINTESPQEALHVEGNIYCSGKIITENGIEDKSSISQLSDSEIKTLKNMIQEKQNSEMGGG